MDGTDRSPPPGSVAAAAVDHLLLSYLYLDQGNMDSYASLLAADARIMRPDLPSVAGRDAVVEQLARIAGPAGRHRLSRVIAGGDCLVAEGRCSGLAALRRGNGYRDVDFVDIVTISAVGLLLDQRRYYGTFLD